MNNTTTGRPITREVHKSEDGDIHIVNPDSGAGIIEGVSRMKFLRAYPTFARPEVQRMDLVFTPDEYAEWCESCI